MKNRLESFIDKMPEFFLEEEWAILLDTLDSMEFKYNKTAYHLENIKRIMNLSSNINMDNYYEEICNPLYYETESFVISLRSTIDIIMHVINQSLRLGINTTAVHLGSIYKCLETPKTVRNILHRYTHNKESALWNFIYHFRNEIVHEKSISQSLPITIDFFQSPNPQSYFEINGNKKNVVSYLENAMLFLERFIIHLFEQLEITIEHNLR